ncbi:MAG: GNAT family N-acetyltransferase [Candidatus Aenigmatarchaeota archaeon]
MIQENKIFDTYIKFNLGYFFTQKIKINGALLLINENLPKDPYLNYALKIKSSNAKIIQKIEKSFNSLGISPHFYITPKTTPKNLETLLLKKGYELIYSDVWMHFEKDKIKKIKHGKTSVRKVGENEFIRVKEIFNEVFTKGELGDPYQGLSHLYGEFFYKRLLDNKKKFGSVVYAAFIKGEMVGVCTLLHDSKVSLIEGLAVLPKFRNMGIGTTLLLSCASQAHALGVEKIFVCTESGSRNEKIFEKIGFVKDFSSRVYGQ